MKDNAVLKIFLVVLAAVFIIHQVYSAVYKPITTESAQYYVATDGLNITGTIIRNETIITSDTNGVLHFVSADGERVAKGGTIAHIYDNASASLTVSRIAELEAQISDIEEIQGYNDIQAADLDLANNKVSAALGNLVFGSAGGNFTTAHSDSTQFLSAINRRQVITGEQTDFSVRLESLRASLAELKAALPTSLGTVTSQTSGYFVSTADGYENILTCDDLESVTPEFLSDVKPQTVPENSIGKIVSDYEWYIAVRVSLNDSLKYKEGESLTIKTTLKSTPTLPVTVKEINISKTDDSAVVIFACNQMNGELANMRTGAMTVISNRYEGLRVSQKALRVVDGETGVYVVSGITVHFVPVNVIYRTDDYIICEKVQTNDDGVLRLYDEVIVKGKKLYDGKVIG